MIQEVKDILSKGGPEQSMDENKVLEEQEFEKKKDEEEETTSKKKETEDTNKEESKEDTSASKDKKEEEKDKKKNRYNLDEIAEYVALQLQFSDLQKKYNELAGEHQKLTEEVEGLRQFKLQADRKAKQDMIDSFYMLSDKDKEDVSKNIDTYSLDEIEAKLAITCVRNKVSFQQEQETPQTNTYNLNQVSDVDDSVPEWVRAVRQHSK